MSAYVSSYLKIFISNKLNISHFYISHSHYCIINFTLGIRRPSAPFMTPNHSAPVSDAHSQQSEWDLDQDTVLQPTDVPYDLPIGAESAALAMTLDSMSRRPATIATVGTDTIAALELNRMNSAPNDRPTRVRPLSRNQ